MVGKLSDQLPKVYNHRDFEAEIYDWWEKEGYFRPEKLRELKITDENSQKYCITLPLPNVTGQLHLGHAITISIEDLMTRYERMRNKETLFIPGTDHAGIATQNVVERQLAKQGISRKEIGREKFIEKVWEWKEQYHARITKQSKSLGISSDWTREHFTLDPDLSHAVREAFYRLYQKGYIYRGEYMVNWCPGRCESAISDLETESFEEDSHLWYIRYPIQTKDWNGPNHEWGSGKWAEGATKFIQVATTRPETIMGDTAIATHPGHSEFGKFIGEFAILPVMGKAIPIITDEHVDPEFGTGAVKITPAHDPNDFEVGKRHNLEFVNIFDEKARILPEISARYASLDRDECRELIVKDLEKEGILIKIEPYRHAVGHCQRCHTVIEPRVSIQWFVKTKPLAEAAMNAVKSGETTILPEREEQRFYHWMSNIRDWCISRQLWWGHRIPIWYCQDCNAEICPKPNVNTVEKCPKCGNNHIKQEEDVLDTWFSSGLWAFSTLGWPNEESEDFKRFYPTDMRETGYDILFFWVAREIMLGIELTGKAPFKHVYLHGLIRNEKGQKISKSMENVEQYDPLNIIEQHGADSLRYTLLSNCTPGMDQNLDPRNVEAAHRFCNKIWQATRYVLGNIEQNESIISFKEIDTSLLQIPDRWILSKLNKLIQQVNEYMENYDYLRMTRELKNFFWADYCDWYLECSKLYLYDKEYEHKEIQKAVLIYVLETFLRLLHPIMPFLTEKLWQVLPQNVKEGQALIIAPWPECNQSLINNDIENQFNVISDFIREIRHIKHSFNIPANKPVPILIQTENKELFTKWSRELTQLAGLENNQMQLKLSFKQPKQSARIVIHGITAFLPLAGMIDLDKERERIQKSLQKVEKMISKIFNKLQGTFAERAPKELVEKEQDKLKEYQDKKQFLQEQLEFLN
ncbi:MAG: valine--tRNA ligase [Promethearchaeia archaeon]|nr:MAG: valine--tRNA ligase [Candidatus Lokiarchaeia archaeon]